MTPGKSKSKMFEVALQLFQACNVLIILDLGDVFTSAHAFVKGTVWMFL